MTGDESGARVRRKLPKALALYGLAVLAATVVWGAFDTARPPYVGWETEAAAGVITVTLLGGMAYWEWYR